MATDKKRPFDRLDADESPIFARQLEYVQSRVFEEKLTPVNYSKYLPVTSEMPMGATTMTRRYFKGFGRAKMIADFAKDFPRVDIGGSEVSVKAKDIGVSYGYSIDEIRRAIYAGLDLEQRRANMARVAVERMLDSLAWLGDADYGIQGFLKYPGTTEFTIPATGTSTTKTWSTKTPAQILTDLNGIKNAVYIGTSGVESINTILLPMAQLDLIKNTVFSAGSDTTVLEFFLRNNPGIAVEELRQLDGAGTGATDMIIGYKKDPQYLSFELPMPFEVFEADKEGMTYSIPCRARVVGTLVYFPSSVAWGEGI